jgi:hypothetical protein
MKCFVTFRLRPNITADQYIDWFRRENVPAVRKMKTIKSYRVWQMVGTLEGEAAFDFLEEMELDDRVAFEQEIESLPEMRAMLDGWYARVTDQVVVYGEEVEQD